MSLQAGSRLGPYELRRRSAPAGWARCGGGRTPASTAASPSSSCPPASPRTRSAASASSARRRRSPRSTIPTSARSSTSGTRATSHFLVMELLEGESLADRLQKGPLPLDQVVKFGAQVADALERRAQAGHRPPRPQARERDADEDRREAPRLRPRPPRRRARRCLGLDRAADRGEAAHHRGDGARHVPVHGPRAARGRGGRPAHRHLRARSASLRDGDGAARVRRQVEDEPDRGDPLDAAAADLVRAAGDAAGARPRGEEVPGEGPGRPLAERPRRGERAALDRGRRLAGGRAHDAVAAPPQPRAAGLGARRRSCRSRLRWPRLGLPAPACRARRGPALPGRARPAPGGPAAPVLQGALALSPDGRRLAFVAVGDAQSSLAVRDLASGETEAPRWN